MADYDRLSSLVLNHWSLYHPKMLSQIREQNRLEKELEATTAQIADLLYELVSVKKMNYPAAWELATQEWALPESGNQDTTTSGDPPPTANPAGTTGSGTSIHENSASATSHRRRPPLRRATSG
jgi:hypothetical protein